ncbi:RND multidrug efflux transporter; Acriflavin resistance protein [hydrothermal vent metagenome]|uniref:RND multidrug efflux transporter Acriflavin resistance protein n=1 Tax=hydrothermal vent metagenome TaxID=652676 RepID=A0A3B1DY17_9ZZZZ
MIKGIIKLGLEKPVLNHMLLLFIFILAIFSYSKIPKEIFPQSALDAISITGTYAGASSDMLDLMAVSQIEDDLSALSEVSKISTIIKSGFFNIKIDLKSGYETSTVLDDVKDIVTKAKVNFPSDMNEPIVKEIVNTIPLITVAIYADKTKQRLLEVADDIKSKLNHLSDLSNITIRGHSDKELLITFNESKIDAYGLDKKTVINTIAQMSSIFPAGIIKDKGRHYYLSSQNGEKDLEKLKDTILKIGDLKIYLRDIATVQYKLALSNTLSHFNGYPNISIGIDKGRSGDAIALVQSIKDILKSEQSKYDNIEFDTYTDTSVWIRNRLNTVVSNILFGLILLTLALFLFINIRIAFVVAIGIPTSFMIGLIFTQHFGYSLNMLSLLGALLALGMLVDEAIVVGENIYRHLEMGKDKMSAALDGAIEMYPAVLAATATTIFAFLPILMITGETGVFMRILPIMISILLLSSLVEAFFFLPLHAQQTFKINKTDKKSDRFWDRSKQIYKNILDYVLKWKYISLITLMTIIVLLTIVFIKIIKFEFMPEFDTTQMYISGSVGAGHKIEETEVFVSKVEQKLLKNFKLGNNIDSISSITGLKLDGKQLPQTEEFYFQIFINLKERAPSNFFDLNINPILSPKYDPVHMTRTKSAKEISKEISMILKDELTSKEFSQLKVLVPGAGIVSNDIEIALSSQNKNETYKYIKLIKEKLGSIKGVNNISDDIVLGNKDLKFTVNSYGQSLGFNETNIANILKSFYFKAPMSKMYDNSGIVRIVFESKNKDIKGSLDNFKLTVPFSSKKVLLNDVVSFTQIASLSQIFKTNGQRVQSVTASLNGATSDEVYKILRPFLNNFPKSINIQIKGEEQENKKIKGEMAQAFIIALILIFISLIIMFDSIIKSIIILSTIPLSILGVLIGHFIMGLNLTMPGLIGIVGLAGVIVNDGIIMMDVIQKSKTLEEIKEYAQMRLRPILLTSLTTILGLSTLIFFASGQTLILQPMAVSLGFGILFATILNLYYLPMIYRIIYLRK